MRVAMSRVPPPESAGVDNTLTIAARDNRDTRIAKQLSALPRSPPWLRTLHRPWSDPPGSQRKHVFRRPRKILVEQHGARSARRAPEPLTLSVRMEHPSTVVVAQTGNDTVRPEQRPQVARHTSQSIEKRRPGLRQHCIEQQHI